jgi:hypothetical protein
MEQVVRSAVRQKYLFDTIKRLYLHPHRDNVLFGTVLVNCALFLAIHYNQGDALTLCITILTILITITTNQHNNTNK